MSRLLALLLDRLTSSSGRHEAPVIVRPEPVLDEAKLTAAWSSAVAMILTLAAALGVTESDAGALGGVLVVVGGAGITVAQAVAILRRAYAVRSQVTPVADPVLEPVLEELADPVE